MRSNTHTKPQQSLAQHTPTAHGTRGTRCPVQVNYAKSTKRHPNPRTDTDVTEGVVVDSTASAAKSSKRVTANSDVAYGKSRASGKDPAVDGLMKTLNTVSVRVHEAQEEGSPVTDTEMIDLLANLDFIPGGACRRVRQAKGTGVGNNTRPRGRRRGDEVGCRG